MRIYKKCPCCGKIMFLMLGSDFGNEIELGSAFGSKDNVPHTDTNHEEDWNCLNRFLNCLNSSHGEVYISLNDKERKKIPKDYQKLILNWTEGGYQKTEEQKTNSKGNKETSKELQKETNKEGWFSGWFKKKDKDWTNIHEDFHSQLEATRKKTRGESLKEQWIKAGFNYAEVKEWVNIGLKPYEFDYATWLRDKKKVSPDWVLNYGDDEELRKEYQDSLPVNWE